MIEIVSGSKRFADITALDKVSLSVPDGSIFGLAGTNGSGKSTLLRAMAGVYRLDNGEVTVDGEPVYENPNAKRKVFLLSDDHYFFNGAGIKENAEFLASVYPNFDMECCLSLTESLKLSEKRNVNTFSKGMKKQAALILALSAKTEYLLCDETFDGLDTVMRQTAKKLFAASVAEGKLTPVIASHNLREIEDICDKICILHSGNVIFTSDLDELKTETHKIQCAFENEPDGATLVALGVVRYEKRGKVYELIAKGDKEALLERLSSAEVKFCEILPLTLDEIFTCSMEERGYDFSKIIQ